MISTRLYKRLRRTVLGCLGGPKQC